MPFMRDFGLKVENPMWTIVNKDTYKTDGFLVLEDGFKIMTISRDGVTNGMSAESFDLLVDIRRAYLEGILEEEYHPRVSNA